MNGRLITSLMIVLALAWASGASADDMVPPTAIKFDHKKHLEAVGLACTDCHQTVAESAVASDRLAPAMDVCGNCHDVTDDNNCGLCHVEGADLGKIAIPKPAVLFSHKKHLAFKDVQCETCHAGIAQSTKTGEIHIPKMATCSTCHEGVKAPNECGACHTDLTHLHPESHVQGWVQMHGRRVRSGDTTCKPCHAPSDCQECHDGAHLTVNLPPLGSQATFAPQSRGGAGLILKRVHDLNYRFTHSIDAKTNKEACAQCHEADTFCADCHQAGAAVGLTRPAWHGGPNWGAIAGAVGTGGGEHARLARRNMAQCEACHATPGEDPVCLLCHMDRNPGLGNDPKTHGPRFKSQVGEGDYHNNPNSICFNCHTFKGPAGGAGFCGYCHGPK